MPRPTRQATPPATLCQSAIESLTEAMLSAKPLAAGIALSMLELKVVREFSVGERVRKILSRPGRINTGRGMIVGLGSYREL